MIIALASDHRGYKLKEKIKKYLIKKNIKVIDCGTNSTDSTDFPIYAHKLGELIQTKKADLGIAICGTGIGMSIALNKMKGITCGKVNNKVESRLCRQHNNANTIAISEKTSWFKTKSIVNAFIKFQPLTDEKYKRRINQIEEYK